MKHHPQYGYIQVDETAQNRIERKFGDPIMMVGIRATGYGPSEQGDRQMDGRHQEESQKLSG